MKKLIAILLCLVTLVCAFTGCVDKEDQGTEINIYMEMPTTFDPAIAYSDQASAQLLSMIYQGLFTVDEDGKLQNGICKKYTVKDNVVEFVLKETCWSDGTTVVAQDFVYAWKRILDPEFQSEAASLLYYINNAVEVKNGDTSIDNLSLYASGDSIITVELIDASFVDQFLYNCASVALYPVRSDAVGKLSLNEPFYDNAYDSNGEKILAGNDVLTTYTWGSMASIIVANGPFYVKRMALYPDSGNPTIILERNKYYYRDTSDISDDALQKYVTPYRINIEFVSEAEAYEAYNSGSVISASNDLPILYNGNVPLANRTTSDNLRDLQTTYTYFFNTNDEMFANSSVRNALSSVLDRAQMAKIAVYGSAAEGLITNGIFYTDRKTSFREKAGNVIGATMSVDEAKSVISAAGAKTGAITISVRDNETEIAIAEYVKGVWEQLGYTVTVEPLANKSARYYEVVSASETGYDVEAVYEGLTRDLYLEKYQSGEFQVIGVQYNMLSTDAFAALVPFSAKYSGNAYDFTESADVFDPIVHVTGYNSTEYEALIEAYLAETNAAKRAEILVDAEKLIIADAPVAPLYYMQGGSVASARLEGVTYDYFGAVTFIEASDSEYVYIPAEEAAILPTKVYSIVCD